MRARTVFHARVRNVFSIGGVSAIKYRLIP